jgi:hypothetical protein
MAGRELADAKPGFFREEKGGACSAIDEAAERLLKVTGYLQLDDNPVAGTTCLAASEAGKRYPPLSSVASYSLSAGYAEGVPCGSPFGCGVEVEPTNYALRRSKRSRFITLFHTATKSFTKISLESADA